MRYALPYRRSVTVVFVSMLGLTAFQLIGPLLVRYAIDTGLNFNSQTHKADGSVRTLMIAAGLIIGVAVLRGIFQYFQTFNAEKLAQHAAYDIRNDIYDHLQRLSFAYHDKAQTGQIMQRATQDVEGVRMFISMGAIRLVYVIILLLASLVLMVRTDVPLAMLSWAFIPPTAILAIRFTRLLRPIMLRTQGLQGELGVVLQENLSGMRVVKAFGRELFEGD
jgi:ATP-binding cassette subfamily B protein